MVTVLAELISEIAGASGTARQKITLAETGRAHSIPI
jgi:hypothetical protein